MIRPVTFLFCAAMACGQQVFDLNVGESAGPVKLLGISDTRDRVRSAVRAAQVEVEIAGVRRRLECGNYRLPVVMGRFRVDCAVTRAYYTDTNANHWALVKDARLRVWPAGGLLVPPRTMVYPVRQRWFASRTQMANEPTYVDDGERIGAGRIYYHAGLDIGGAEGMVEVVAASAGKVLAAGKAVMDEYKSGDPVQPRYDRVYVLDSRGWIELYCHLQSIDAAVKPGAHVAMGQKIGILGKEGDSGGWSHLHFEILSRQASGKWGTMEGYAFLWQTYQRQYKPDLIAVARPHHAALVGEKVTLDGSRSWSRAGKIARYEWTSGDGPALVGERVERTWSSPGTYSEILKITDSRGNFDWDFATVNVLDPGHPNQAPPSIHATYSPTMNIHAGQPVTFQVRTFGTTANQETWDFGDGAPKGTTKSDGNAVPMAKDGYAKITHAFARRGDYIVRVERANERGDRATAHLHVRVESGTPGPPPVSMHP